MHVRPRTESDASCAGKLQADVAAAAGVQVFVFSTLENVEERTKVTAALLSGTSPSASHGIQ